MSDAKITVLVADDDSTIRRNLVRLLQSEATRPSRRPTATRPWPAFEPSIPTLCSSI